MITLPNLFIFLSLWQRCILLSIRRKQFRSSNVVKQNELQIDLLRKKNKSKNALSSTMVMPFYQNKTVGIGLVKTF